jgi:hypothetical protein
MNTLVRKVAVAARHLPHRSRKIFRRVVKIGNGNFPTSPVVIMLPKLGIKFPRVSAPCDTC